MRCFGMPLPLLMLSVLLISIGLCLTRWCPAKILGVAGITLPLELLLFVSFQLFCFYIFYLSIQKNLKMLGSTSSHPRPLAPTANNPSSSVQQSRAQRFSTSNDSAIMEQIQATHAPDGREVDVKPIITIVEEILIHSIAKTVEGDHGKGEIDPMTKAAAFAKFDMPDSLAFVINKISCELSCKSSGDGDAHATTMVLLNTLPNYPWHAKVVLTLAAFAVNFGEFWLVARPGAENTLAKSVFLLKQLPDLVENPASLKHQFDALIKLVKAAFDVTRCIVKFKELPSEYISEDTPMSDSSAHIPVAAYWTIRSIDACSSQIASFVGLRKKFISSTTEAWELSSLAHKMSSIYEHLKGQWDIRCQQYKDETIPENAFVSLWRLYDVVHIENMKILKALIYAKEDPPPLIDCSNNSKASLKVLRRKHVLLLISDLDLTQEEIIILDNLYKDARVRPETHYEIVWMPIVDRETWNDASRQKFEHLLSMMPWYSVRDPMIIEEAVIKYIREVWNFKPRTILVALDPQGRLSSPNALHMIWIWGNLAFPFTNEKEESLWKTETWSLEFLVDGIDPTVLQWMAEGKIICLYGGEDLEWIQKFTSTAMGVAKAGNFTLEMVYVGKNNAKERMQRMINTFATRKFSYFWPNVTSIWFFWARLESMLYSKLQHGRNVENDQIMSEVMTVLSFDGSDQGWAIFCKGPNEMARAKGDNALNSLEKYGEWKEAAERNGFIPALNDYLKHLHTPH